MPRAQQVKFTRIFAPVAGLHKVHGFQDAPPFTTYDAKNVRAVDPRLERIRLGRRPGLSKWCPTRISAASNKILLLDEVRYGTGGNSTKVVAIANGELWSGSSTSMSKVTGVTLASTYQLTSAELYGKLYICGQTSTDKIAVYDPTGGTLTLLSAAAGLVGTPPAGRICCNWRGALVVAGVQASPNVVYCSRTSADSTGLLDWDYGTDVANGSAWATNDPKIGTVDDDVTALIPFHSCLIVGYKTCIGAIDGHPMDGGRFRLVDEHVGITGPKAWAIDREGILHFNSRDGQYTMEGACGGLPKLLSRAVMPQNLRNINTSSYAVAMHYDLDHQGVEISVPIYTLGSAATHYWMNAVPVWGQSGIGANISFWPHIYATDHEAFSLHRLRNTLPGTNEAGLLRGCRDGYIRVEDYDVATDDSTSFTDYVYYGPVPLAGPGEDGILMELHVELASNSGNVTIDVLTGDTAQACMEETAVHSTYTTQSTHRNSVFHPRARGKCFALKVYGSVADSNWCVENIEVLRRPARRAQK